MSWQVASQGQDPPTAARRDAGIRAGRMVASHTGHAHGTRSSYPRRHGRQRRGVRCRRRAPHPRGQAPGLGARAAAHLLMLCRTPRRGRAREPGDVSRPAPPIPNMGSSLLPTRPAPLSSNSKSFPDSPESSPKRLDVRRDCSQSSPIQHASREDVLPEHSRSTRSQVGAGPRRVGRHAEPLRSRSAAGDDPSPTHRPTRLASASAMSRPSSPGAARVRAEPAATTRTPDRTRSREG